MLFGDLSTMLKVCIVVDVEGFISLKQKNPMWNFLQRIKAKINYLLRNVKYDKNAFPKIYNLIVKYKFPISFMLVGRLFKPISKNHFIDYGYHTLNHKPLIYLSDKEIENEVKNIYNAASFSAPLWMIEEISNPKRIFKALKKEKYKITIYRGRVNGKVPVKGDKVLGIEKPFFRFGLKCVYPSFLLNNKEDEIKKILDDIMNNRKKGGVYCITTHDFIFKNLKNLEILIRILKKMEKQRLIKIVNLRQLA